MSFESKIISASHRLNLNDREVLDWMYQNQRLLLDYSIQEIATEVHMSKSFISKLIKKIGYSSFAEFKVLLQSEQATPEKLHLSNAIELQERDLSETKRLLKQTNFTALFDDFTKTEFVYCYGTGHTNQNYIRELSRNLMSIGNKRVVYLSGKSELESIIPLISERDCFFISSHSGESKELIEFLEILRLKKAMIISITAFSNNSLVRLADYNLFYFSTPIRNPLKNHVIHSFLPLNLCIDTLIRNYLGYLE